jgi:hypothetical protein
MRLLGPRWRYSSPVIILHTGNLLWSGTKSTRRREPTRLLGSRWRYSSPVIILHTGDLL